MNNIVKKLTNPRDIQCCIYIIKSNNIINLLFTLGKYTINEKNTTLLYCIYYIISLSFR